MRSLLPRAFSSASVLLLFASLSGYSQQGHASSDANNVLRRTDTTSPSRWQRLPTDMEESLRGHACTWADDDGKKHDASSPHLALIVGGSYSARFSRRQVPYVWEYDVSANTVKQLPEAPVKMYGSAAAVVDDVLYVYQTYYYQRPEEYANTTIFTFDLKTQRWEAVAFDEKDEQPSRDQPISPQWVVDQSGHSLLLYNCEGVWDFNVKSRKWRMLKTKGDDTPQCLSGASWTIDKENNEAYLVGGSPDNGATFPGTIYKFLVNPKKWVLLSAKLPEVLVTDMSTAIQGHTLYGFGGRDKTNDVVDTVMLSLDLSRENAGVEVYRAPEGQPSPAKRWQTCMLAAERDSLYVFGGWELGDHTVPPFIPGNDVWSFSTKQ